jgi:hypothetical protein
MTVTSPRSRIVALGALAVACLHAVFGTAADRDSAGTSVRPPRPIAPRSNVLTTEPWDGVPIAPLSPAELDGLVAAELREDRLQPAARTTDEQFLRRVSLDLAGHLPTPQELAGFLADRDPAKRSKVIDKLLASDAYAGHRAKYWRDVVSSKYTDRRQVGMVPAFEKWLTDQFKANKSWGDTAWAMLTAEGFVQIRFGGPGAGDTESNGAAVFLLAHLGDDQAEERAAETSRVFLGIQLQCAQCHDHPFDEWTQRQFHELAGYFSRIRARQIVRPQDGPPRVELMATGIGEHRQPDKNDPTRGTTVSPRFLSGAAPKARATDKERRAALADAITGPENFWFAAAFVNRTWAELMGQGFFQPVDDMGPGKDATMPSVLVRLAASFRATDYDVKQLLRTICNSEAYQRQIRPGAPADGHLHFASAYPTRLRAEVLWRSLQNVLGSLAPPDTRPGFRATPGAPGFARFGRGQSLETTFLSEFRFDPSLGADEVEGSIPQALMLMNNREIHRAIEARGASLLATVVTKYPTDEDAVRALYSQVLCRRPTDGEMSKARSYIDRVGKREEAFEDILWVLLNSTEFQTRR